MLKSKINKLLVIAIIGITVIGGTRCYIGRTRGESVLNDKEYSETLKTYIKPPMEVKPVHAIEEIIEIVEEVPEVIPEVVEVIEVPKVINNKEWFDFEISYYCACYSCTQNDYDIGLTASGNYAVEGVTIATPSDIPFGSKVYIEGVGEYTVQDRGGYIQYATGVNGTPVMRVDIYLDSHTECLERGRHTNRGYIIREGK